MDAKGIFDQYLTGSPATAPTPQPPQPPQRRQPVQPPAGAAGNFVSWQSVGKGQGAVVEQPVDFSRGTVIMRPPDGGVPQMLQVIQGYRAHNFDKAPGYCSWALQELMAKYGVPGAQSSGMGNAKDMPQSLRRIGFRQVGPGEMRPGDVVIYTSGAGGYGHIGVATGGPPRDAPKHWAPPPQQAAQPTAQRRPLPAPTAAPALGAQSQPTSALAGPPGPVLGPLATLPQETTLPAAQPTTYPSDTTQLPRVPLPSPMADQLRSFFADMPELQSVVDLLYGGGQNA